MISLPETVRSILGEEATRDFSRWLEGAMAEDPIRREEWNDARTRLGNVEHAVDELQSDVAVLKSDVAVLKTDVAVLKADVASLKTEVGEIRADLRALRSDMNARFDRLIEIFNDRFDRQEERMAQQTRWAIGVLGLVSTSVTLLLAAQTFGMGG